MTHQPPDCGTHPVEAPAVTHVVPAGTTKQQELICALSSFNLSKKTFPNPKHRLPPFPTEQQTPTQGCAIWPRKLSKARGSGPSRMRTLRREFVRSLLKLNSDAQLANDILLEFILNLYFTGHLTVGHSHSIVR